MMNRKNKDFSGVAIYMVKSLHIRVLDEMSTETEAWMYYNRYLHKHK